MFVWIPIEWLKSTCRNVDKAPGLCRLIVFISDLCVCWSLSSCWKALIALYNHVSYNPPWKKKNNNSLRPPLLKCLCNTLMWILSNLRYISDLNQASLCIKQQKDIFIIPLGWPKLKLNTKISLHTHRPHPPYPLQTFWRRHMRSHVVVHWR